MSVKLIANIDFIESKFRYKDSLNSIGLNPKDNAIYYSKGDDFNFLYYNKATNSFEISKTYRNFFVDEEIKLIEANNIPEDNNAKIVLIIKSGDFTLDIYTHGFANESSMSIYFSLEKGTWILKKHKSPASASELKNAAKRDRKNFLFIYQNKSHPRTKIFK